MNVIGKVRSRLTVKNELGRALIAEFLGTALLVLIGNCVLAGKVLSRDKVNTMINVNVGFGLAIAFGVAVSARLSGGHINPAVSLMFLTFRKLTPLRFVLYVLVQFAGAFIGAAMAFIVNMDAIKYFDGGLRRVTGIQATAGIFASYPADHLGAFNGLLDQVIGTAVFCLLIAHIVDSRNPYPAWCQPMLIGTAFVMLGAAFGLNAGYPLNPARDFGPRVFTLLAGYGGEVISIRNYNWFWIPIIGPMIGALVGGGLYQLALGFQTPESDEVTKYEVVATSNRELQPLTMTKAPINGNDEP